MPQHPNLFDTQDPQQGLMGPPRPEIQFPQMEGRKPNLLDRMLGLYGQDPTSHIPEDQRSGALQQGLREAGLATLAAGGRGHESLTPGQAIGTFFGTLQGTGARMGAQNEAQQRKQQIQEMVDSGNMNPEQMQAIMMQLIASGTPEDLAAARTIAEVIKSQGGADRYRNVPKGGLLFDTSTGKWLRPDGQGGVQEIDRWVDLGGMKVPEIDGQLDFEQAQGKTMTPGEIKRSYDSNLKWAVGKYENAIKPIEPSFRLTMSAIAQSDRAIAGDGAAQLMLLYGFIRALDPNSVVREGEVRLAQEAATLRDQAIMWYNFMIDDKSKIMSPNMAVNITNVMKQLAQSNMDFIGSQRDQWAINIGGHFGIDQSLFRDPTAIFTSQISQFAGIGTAGSGQGKMAPGQAGGQAYSDLANRVWDTPGSTTTPPPAPVPGDRLREAVGE